MNNLKKLVSVAAVGTLMLGLVACGGNNAPAEEEAVEENAAAEEEVAE
ncbi:MAG: hypothetical protein Q4E37_06965 [Tissierellia bacterium]|nr:hypothetical protein [Tissierellia bacterium]